jgi:hypothetical protein
MPASVPSPTTRQAILRPLSVFRPAFRAISQTLSDIDLVFVEEAFERLMLDYDRVFSGECVEPKARVKLTAFAL